MWDCQQQNMRLHGESAMFGIGLLHWLFAPVGLALHLLPMIIVLVVLYWVIRLAVRHGNRDSRGS
jgi:hypothetical protein